MTSRLPKLRIMRDSNPVTGQIWVVDENNHMVASFKIMLPEYHVKGATVENVDIYNNILMAKALIEHLECIWSRNNIEQ